MHSSSVRTGQRAASVPNPTATGDILPSGGNHELRASRTLKIAFSRVANSAFWQFARAPKCVSGTGERCSSGQCASLARVAAGGNNAGIARRSCDHRERPHSRERGGMPSRAETRAIAAPARHPMTPGCVVSLRPVRPMAATALGGHVATAIFWPLANSWAALLFVRAQAVRVPPATSRPAGDARKAGMNSAVPGPVSPSRAGERAIARAGIPVAGPAVASCDRPRSGWVRSRLGQPATGKDPGA